jgi:hypothetical protein
LIFRAEASINLSGAKRREKGLLKEGREDALLA